MWTEGPPRYLIFLSQTSHELSPRNSHSRLCFLCGWFIPHLIHLLIVWMINQRSSFTSYQNHHEIPMILLLEGWCLLSEATQLQSSLGVLLDSAGIWRAERTRALEGPGRPWGPWEGGDSKAKEEIEAALGWKCEQFFNNLTWKGCPRLELKTKRFKSCIELEKRGIITKNWLSKWTEHRQISCERHLSYVKASKPSY